MNAFSAEVAAEFGPLLRSWRTSRSQSQLALSLHAGVSSRHLSYMETGRAKPINIPRVMISPDGMRPFVENWEEAAGKVLARVRRDLGEAHARDAADEALLRDIAPVFETLPKHPLTAPLPLIVPFVVSRDGMRLQFFTTIATLGTPLDVTLQELRIETLFPADTDTKRLLATRASTH